MTSAIRHIICQAMTDSFRAAFDRACHKDCIFAGLNWYCTTATDTPCPISETAFPYIVRAALSASLQWILWLFQAHALYTMSYHVAVELWQPSSIRMKDTDFIHAVHFPQSLLQCLHLLSLSLQSIPQL